MYCTTSHPTPLGPVTLASDGRNLVGLWLKGQKYFAATIPASCGQADDLPVFSQARQWLDSYFRGQKPAIADLPLAPAGSVFRKAVWTILCAIPYGQWTTYGEIARKMAAVTGKATGCQAVGGAVGHNPVSIIIPCHRVVGSNGSLTGYAAGLAAKTALLQREGVDVTRFSVPKKGTAL